MEIGTIEPSFPVDPNIYTNTHTEVDKCHLFSILHRVYGALKTDSLFLLAYILCFLNIVVGIIPYNTYLPQIPSFIVVARKVILCNVKIGTKNSEWLS